MKTAGWILIWTGVGLVVIGSLIDWIVLLKKRPTGGTSEFANVFDVGFPDLDKVAELLKAPHGAGIALVIIGAVLLLASQGIDVSFGTPTPSPTPSA